MRLVRRIVLFVAASLLVGSCAASRSEADSVVVFAAASLTDAFMEIETAFEQANPRIEVTMSYAASSTLRVQISEGASADVYASANTANMDAVVNAGESAGTPRVFAVNSLEIAVPTGNPGEVAGLADFADPELLIGVCAPQVPCGELAAAVLSSAGVTPALDTAEPNVRALLAKLEAGELDAGIVYRTDIAASADRVDGIRIDAAVNVESAYPITVLAGADSPAAAEAFVAFVISQEGGAILSRFGFGLP